MARVQVTKERGEYVARIGSVEAREDSEHKAVQAVLLKAKGAHVGYEHGPVAEAAPAVHAHEGESMGDGPSAPLGSRVGD